MILADKIINLRKKLGLSQEELAEKLGVSRQSVSKWEGAQSIPDLDKIITLSKIFGVSTDFLLKDDLEIEDMEVIENDDQVVETKKVTMEMANDYIARRLSNASRIATGVFLCIISPIVLIILSGLATYYPSTIKEKYAVSIALIVMVILVAIAITLFLTSGAKTKEYEFITTEVFETEYGVTGMVKQKKKEYQEVYNKYTIIGVVLCVLSVIPLFIGISTLRDLAIVIAVAVTILLVAIGVFMIVFAGCKMGTYVSLLQEGDYAKNKKNSLASSIISTYWLFVTAIYLLVSFITQKWNITWIIWVIGGVISAAISPIVYALVKKQKKDKK